MTASARPAGALYCRSCSRISGNRVSRATAERLGGVRLLIVDPIVSAVAGDSHKNAAVRNALQPIVDFAARHQCAVIGITHFTKGTPGRDPIERVTGSVAFAALARLVMVAAKESIGDSQRRVFVRAKSNIGPDDGGFTYSLEMVDVAGDSGTVTGAKVVWGEALEGNAREILGDLEETPQENHREKSARKEAKALLLDLLDGAARPARDIRRIASEEGHSWPTIKRAKAALGIKAIKTSMAEGWVWRLPRANEPKETNSSEESQQERMSPFGDFEPLRAEDDKEDKPACVRGS